tara:strand:+ start:229 stop:531 length:303 start_codon:yes stop_codon:yes gene_type:complete
MIFKDGFSKMAIGDTINGILAGAGAVHNFQPAVGAEIIITFVAGYGTAYVGHSNGVLRSYNSMISTNGSLSNIKCGITNTIYLSIESSVNPVSYSGLQIK